MNQEVEQFLSTHPPEQVLIVLTGGEVLWDADNNDFDAAASTAISPALHGVFAEEPKFLDLRWAHDEAHLDLRNGRIRSAVAELAAPLHGVDRDELDAEDLRHFRRTRRFRRIAVAALVVLSLMASLTALVAVVNARRAEARRLEGQSRQLATLALAEDDQPIDTSLLLSAESFRIRETADALSGLLTVLDRAGRLERILRPEDAQIMDTNTAAFSPDGRHVLAGGNLSAQWDSGSLTVWDASNGKEAASALDAGFCEAGNTFECFANVGDIHALPERLVVTTFQDTVHLFTYDGRPVEALPIDARGLSRDGRFGLDIRRGRSTLWDVPAGREIVTVGDTGVDGATLAPAYSDDGKLVAVPRSPSSFDVRRTDDGQPVAGPFTTTARPDSLGSGVAFGPEGAWMVFATPEGVELVPLRADVADVAFEPAGTTATGVGVAMGGGFVVSQEGVWATATGKLLWRPPPGARLAPAGPGHVVMLEPRWELRDIATGAVRDSANRAGGQVEVDTRGTRAVTYERAQGMALWDLSAGTKLAEDSDAPSDVAWSPDGRFLASAGRQVRLWPLESTVAPPEVVDRGEALSVAFSPSGDRLVAAAGRGAKIWSMDGTRVNGRLLADHTLEAPYYHSDGGGPFRSVGVTPSSGRVVTKDVHGEETRLYDTDGSLLGQVKLPAGSRVGPLVDDDRRIVVESTGTVSPDASHAAVGNHNGRVSLLGTDGKVIASRETRPRSYDQGDPERDSIDSLEFSPDGSTLVATTAGNGSVLIWRHARGEDGVTFLPHEGVASDVAISPDGTLLAVADPEGVEIWATGSQQAIGTLTVPEVGRDPTDSGLQVSFDSDGQLIGVDTLTGTVRVWDLAVDRWVAQACELAGRNLTPEEWEVFLPGTRHTATCPEYPLVDRVPLGPPDE